MSTNTRPQAERGDLFHTAVGVMQFAKALGAPPLSLDTLIAIMSSFGFSLGRRNQNTKLKLVHQYLVNDRTDTLYPEDKKIIGEFLNLSVPAALLEPKSVPANVAPTSLTTVTPTTSERYLDIIQRSSLTASLHSMVAQLSARAIRALAGAVEFDDLALVAVLPFHGAPVLIVGTVLGATASYEALVNGEQLVGHPDRVKGSNGEQVFEAVKSADGRCYARPLYITQEVTAVCRSKRDEYQAYWAVRVGSPATRIEQKEYIALLPKHSAHYQSLVTHAVDIS